MVRTVNKIYVHCSASRAGTVKSIREAHIKRGFRDIGYHFIILNPFSTWKKWFKHYFIKDYLFTSITDGKIEFGRILELAGAHVKHDNATSIGVCYVGITPTPAQYLAIATLCLKLMREYDISIQNVLGHHEWYKNNHKPLGKTCPNIDMISLRRFIELLAA